uniref:Exonuclease 1 n=1 Tax=Amorphochlora amoebiformis TaxID=1561963 RepID=A0A7S0H6A0_9EUKA
MNVKQIQSEGVRETIVVDGYSVISWAFQNHLDVMILDTCQITKRIHSLVHAFRSCGFRLVCFFDSVVESAKHNTWFKRRQYQADGIIQINLAFEKADHGYLRAGELSRRVGSWPVTQDIIRTIPEAFESAGCVVKTCTEEADKQLVGFALDSKAYAVLSSDSDMMIYPVKLFLNINTLRILNNGGIQCKAVRRSRLLSTININPHQLHKLALWLGNDICSGNKRPVHQNIVSLRRGHKPPQPPNLVTAMKKYYTPSRIPPGVPNCGPLAMKFHIGIYHASPLIEIVDEVKENSGKRPPIFTSLLPLRKSIYDSLGIQVEERICIAGVPLKKWKTPNFVGSPQPRKIPKPPSLPRAVDEKDPGTFQKDSSPRKNRESFLEEAPSKKDPGTFQEVSWDLEKERKEACIMLIEKVLAIKQLHLHINQKQREALLRQVTERGRHTLPEAHLTWIRLSDLHARSAFLEACALLKAAKQLRDFKSMKSTQWPPKTKFPSISEYFCGPLYHYLLSPSALASEDPIFIN